MSTVADALASLAYASSVVAALPHEERAALGERLEMRYFERGDRLAVDGMEAEGLYFIVSGEVAILAHVYGAFVNLGNLRAGETVGEVELVLCRRSSVDAVATRPTATLFLSRVEYGAVVRCYPNLLLGLYAVAIRRGAEAPRLAAPRPLRGLPPPRVTEIEVLPEPQANALRPESLAPANLPPRSVPRASPRTGSPSSWVFAGVALGAAAASIFTVVILLTQPAPAAHAPAAIASTPASATAAAAVTTATVPPAPSPAPQTSVTAPVKAMVAGANKPRIKPRQSIDNARDASAMPSAASSAAAPAGAANVLTAPSTASVASAASVANVHSASSADDFGPRE